MYIPPANSLYARIAIFDEIEDTIIDFRARYVNADFCIMGDLNARTSIADDFLVNSKYDNCQPDDELEMSTLNSLNIQEKRVSVDNIVNTYGNRLLELCKSANMYIVNGRFDNDALQGKATCDNVSVVDYVICSPSIFSYLDSFIVQYYDPMLSDIHCAVNTTFKYKNRKSLFKTTTMSRSRPIALHYCNLLNLNGSTSLLMNLSSR